VLSIHPTFGEFGKSSWYEKRDWREGGRKGGKGGDKCE
jgi:hypothetical protein